MFSVYFCRDGEGTDEVTSLKIVKKLADAKYTGIGKKFILFLKEKFVKPSNLFSN